MRGAPQVGFSTTIRKINSRTSFGVGFLPTRVPTLEISFQYKRKPARCQRITVSGVTTIRACFQPDQKRLTATQNSLSNGLRRGLTPPLQNGKMLAQCKILEEQTLSHAKEANQHSEAQADESKHGQEL